MSSYIYIYILMHDCIYIITSEGVEREDTEAQGSSPSPSYIISLNMGSLSLVGINDFNGQNVPVIRALLDGTTFYAEGKSKQIFALIYMILCGHLFL